MQEKKEFLFIPELSVNNKSDEKIVEIDGEKQVVKVKPKQGFNIKRKDEDNKFVTEFFTKDLVAPILMAKYELRSKYSCKTFFFSNEFEFEEGMDNVRIYAPIEKKVIFEGTYAEAKERFDTGQKNAAGFPIKEFDTYVVLYVLYNETIFRVKWKMTKGCNWFEYKKEFDGDPLYSINTIFKLDLKRIGDNDFWELKLERGGEADEEKLELVIEKLKETLNNKPKKEKQESLYEEEINIDNVPF